jgi:hypothetical protein
MNGEQAMAMAVQEAIDDGSPTYGQMLADRAAKEADRARMQAENADAILAFACHNRPAVSYEVYEDVRGRLTSMSPRELSRLRSMVEADTSEIIYPAIQRELNPGLPLHPRRRLAA